MEMLPTEKGKAVDDPGWRQSEKENQEFSLDKLSLRCLSDIPTKKLSRIMNV